MKRELLMTEGRNSTTVDLDSMSPLELVTAMNREDAFVPKAIEPALPEIARAVEAIAESFARGGRLIYVGSGTSGRIGALDASECAPTFGTDPDMVQFIIAGGEIALTHATEASEDSAELGHADMAEKRPNANDVIVGLAASGYTPYTIAAVKCAADSGATTVAITCNRGSALGKAADIRIEVEVGPEVLTGSSRLKAGTAQKLICNMLTTGAMARRGMVYSNFMVNLRLNNKKLHERGIAILETLTGVSRDRACQLLDDAELNLPTALVMAKSGNVKAKAEERLQAVNGNVRKAIEG